MRSQLVRDAELRRLEEQGIMSAFKAGLALLFKGLGAAISGAFGKASSSYDPSKNDVKYVPSTPGKTAADLSPKTDAYDQVYALGQVLWHIDTAIDLAMADMEFGVNTLKDLEFPADPEDSDFSEKLKSGTENISSGAGYFSAYLSKAESSKVSEVGSSLEPGETLTTTLESFAKSLLALEGLNVVSDWDNIVSSKAVNNVLDRKDENSEAMKNLINKVKGSSMQNIPRLPELKALIDEANAIAIQAEEVVDFAAGEAGEKPEESALLDHKLAVSSLRDLISEILRKKA